jgi:hypothetical protein
MLTDISTNCQKVWEHTTGVMKLSTFYEHGLLIDGECKNKCSGSQSYRLQDCEDKMESTNTFIAVS